MLSPKCPFLGDETGGTKECPTCNGKVRLKLFSCSHPQKPDEVTAQDCQVCEFRPKAAPAQPPPVRLGKVVAPPVRVAIPASRTLLLRHHLSPGDVLVMTAAIYSLHRAHPGKFATAVETAADAIFEHNPNVIPKEEAIAAKAERIEMHYPAIHQSNQRGVHFMQGFCEHMEQTLGVRVPLATNRPLLYLSDEEKGWMSQVQQITGKPAPFWLICAGRKNDYTAKHWGVDNFQSVVDRLRGKIQFVQVGAKEHHHPPLRGVLNLVGKTDMRQLIRLAWHAQGGLGGVTLLQHLMAAHEKPYACILGGREPVQWNQYPRQQTLHTLGMLDCCAAGGCWKGRTVPLGDGDEKDKDTCKRPTFGDDAIPQCMAMIRPADVADRIAAFA